MWGAMAELKEEMGEIEELITMRAQERQDMLKGTNKGSKEKSDTVSRQEEEKKVEVLKGYKRELHTGTNKTMMCQLPIAC